ncbi:MAG: hypothetical protein KME13_23435 [Myxacorys californica WJT36-NPBG1]|jgi:hypothetical protein|nr:hypothetical protein [Myxacorys californica WJT36-NPBG1]
MQSLDTTIDRFSSHFLPHVDRSKFQIDLSLVEDTIKIHIKKKLPEQNEGFTIGKFYGQYRDEMIEAVVQTGEEIQRFQISCEEREFRSHNVRNLLRSPQNLDRF